MADSDLAGKVILLTGAADGIGNAAARNFVRRGADLTIVGRDKTKTLDVLEELQAEASSDTKLDHLLCDLARPADVQRAADEFLSRHDRLHVLVNNAGATFKEPREGPDGIEIAFALNHLAYFQLTRALLPLLRKTAGSRVVCTSSAMQGRGSIDLATMHRSWRGNPGALSGPGAYAARKLANIVFVRELQRRLDEAGDSVVVNCFEPGMVKTSFGYMGGHDQGTLINLVYTMAAPFASTPDQGADSLVWLATAPEAAKLKGEYVSKRKVREAE